MKLVSFCLLTALALLYAGLTIAETMTYRKWEHAVNDQKDIQYKVQYYQHLNGIINQLVRRMAVDSPRDPALAQLLIEHRIKVVNGDSQPTESGTETTPNTTAPSSDSSPPPGNSTQAPPSSTPSHP